MTPTALALAVSFAEILAPGSKYQPPQVLPHGMLPDGTWGLGAGMGGLGGPPLGQEVRRQGDLRIGLRDCLQEGPHAGPFSQPRAGLQAHTSQEDHNMEVQKELTPQSQTVWDYLKTGRSLTNLIASATLRVGSVSRRMTEVLRNKEVHAYLEASNQEITKTWDKDGTGRRYIKYQMKEKANVSSPA